MMASSPLIAHPGCAIILPSCFCPDIAYYAALASYPVAAIDPSMRYDKRAKHVHRTVIASTHGPMTLTVPVQKPAATHGAVWSDILVSPHGQWWHLMVTALESAYGRTPFFEYYADMILPLLGENSVNKPITALNDALHRAICRILGLETVTVPVASLEASELELHDCRRALPAWPHMPPYYQLRAHSLGFLPSMSILDLIFNLGPESPLHLQKYKRVFNSPQVFL